jgi:hypothetical protein
MRYIYESHKGGKPMNLGINRAKRLARTMDRRDRLMILAHLGSMPKQDRLHQELVKQRHRYYLDSIPECTEVQQINAQGARECRRRLLQNEARFPLVF